MSKNTKLDHKYVARKVKMEMSTEFLWGIWFKMSTWKTEKELEDNIKIFFLRTVWVRSKFLGASALDCPL
jgi:hypothetical protein